MAITFNDNAQVNAPKPLDAKYMKFSSGIAQPYASSAEAISSITSSYRYQYLTVLCLMNGDAVEYWWQSNTTDGGLIPKSKESYTFNSTTSILLLNGYLYTRIVVTTPTGITGMTIGTTLSGTDIEPGANVTPTTPYSAVISIYPANTTLYFSNLNTSSKILLYKSF